MRFLIVDDHAVLREGLSALLRQGRPDCVVLGAGDGARGLEIARAQPDIDVVFLDLEMPGLSGVALVEAFGAQNPELPIVVLSSSESPNDARRALAAGALGYVPKSASSKTLMAALTMVLQGDIYVPPLLLGETSSVGAPAGAARSPNGRTERQVEVLRLVASGLSNKEIAKALDLSDKTVKVHLSAIFKALGVVNRMQAANAARKAGLTAR